MLAYSDDSNLPCDWQVGHSDWPENEPEQWVAATVPGAVQLDWAAAHDWPPLAESDNVTQYRWMEDRYWHYRCRIPCGPPREDQRLVLTIEGIDYAWELSIDGILVHRQEGMFTPCELDISELARDDSELRILLQPAPKGPGGSDDRIHASRCCKPACSYGWDWHPRLVPLGIWQPLRIAWRPVLRLHDLGLRSTLDDDLGTGHLHLRVGLSSTASAHALRLRLFDADDRQVAEETLAAKNVEMLAHELQVDQPRLWWPRGQGDAYRYRCEIALLDAGGQVVDLAERRIGFRRVELRMHPTAWEAPEAFPKSRSEPPMRCHVNRRPVFIKGSNWIPPDLFPGRVTDERLRRQVELAAEANLNCLRVWGGGPVNKPAFHEACDELGILVIQEFPLACNPYPDHSAYLIVLEQEARSIVDRLRVHPSTAMWSGGNELFNAWSGMTDQSRALRMLGAICLELDPHTPFLPTLPVSGVGHGPYVFRDADSGEEIFHIMPRSRCTAHTEFGCPGPSPAALIKRIVPADELWPPRRETAWEVHHGFDAWSADTWLCLDTLRHYFGEPADLDELVRTGQLLQAAGFSYLFEESRRQAPRCSMAINWCFQDAWPSVANNSLLSWPEDPKPAYHAVAASCRPTLFSARLPRFAFTAGEIFEAECWLLNDAPTPVDPRDCEASLHWNDESLPLLRWSAQATGADRNLPGPTLRARLPAHWQGLAELRLTCPGDSDLDSRYDFVVRAKPQSTRSTGSRALNA